MQIRRITLCRGAFRTIVYIENEIGNNCPQVHDNVTVQGELWRVICVELVNVLPRFPG